VDILTRLLRRHSELVPDLSVVCCPDTVRHQLALHDGSITCARVPDGLSDGRLRLSTAAWWQDAAL
jgi:hypothetical protein